MRQTLQRWGSNGPHLRIAFVAAVAALSAGCGATHKTPARPPSGAPLRRLTATKQQLVASYNAQASSIHSVNASVSMKLVAGTAYSGIIQQYHEIKGFVLAQKPANIRVIGQAPVVGTNIFDMASDGETFSIYIPSKSKFVTGPANLQRPSAKPIENLRPQHLTEAIFWPAIPPDAPVLFEAGDEEEARYYILTILENPATPGATTQSAAAASPEWNIGRRVWFDRSDLSVARVQIYSRDGDVQSDIRYTQWDNFGTVRFARQIEITRPVEDYQLTLTIQKLTANETISADRFVLKQPPGTQLVRVGAETGEPKP
jgi:hypothetical protein